MAVQLRDALMLWGIGALQQPFDIEPSPKHWDLNPCRQYQESLSGLLFNYFPCLMLLDFRFLNGKWCLYHGSAAADWCSGLSVTFSKLKINWLPNNLQQYRSTGSRNYAWVLKIRGCRSNFFHYLFPNSAKEALRGLLTATRCCHLMLPPAAAAWFEPTPVELHRTTTLEGHFTNWATAPRLM